MRQVVDGCATNRQRLVHVLEHTGLIRKSLSAPRAKGSLPDTVFLCFWHKKQMNVYEGRLKDVKG